MIQELCNIGNEHLIDTFYKVAVFEATQLTRFNYLTADAAVLNIFETIPDDYQVLLTELLPEDITVTNPPSITSSGSLTKPSIKFTLTPQDKNLQTLLETYHNKEVVVLVSKRNTTHIYGTSAQPLLFSYSELNSNKPSGLKGYTINITGNVYGTSKLFENIVFTIYNRGLAFELAQEM